MNNAIEIEMAAGELIDKLTIRIQDAEKRANVRSEFAAVRSVAKRWVLSTTSLLALGAELREVNGRLWEIEDEIRDCEQRQQDLALLSSSLPAPPYRTNDRRAELEREINLLLGSRLIEEKSYRPL
jgi:hypothetical protein